MYTTKDNCSLESKCSKKSCNMCKCTSCKKHYPDCGATNFDISFGTDCGAISVCIMYEPRKY